METWAPLCYKVFIWLVTLDRCWTAERRARHGLSHSPTCVLCHQALETIDHLLVGCPFSREIWHRVLSSFRLTAAIPTAQDRFIDWWSAATLNTPHSLRKGFASLAVLTAWSLWRHRNAVLFDSPAHPPT